MALINTSNSNYNNSYTDSSIPGFNGLSGFKTWECYMLIKYGKPEQYGVGGKYEYLIELPIYPDDVTESIATSWAKQNILGRSAPISAYAQTELKSVNFSLNLHRDLLTGSFSHTTETLMTTTKNGVEDALSRQAAGFQRQSSNGPFNTRTWYVNINKMLQMSCYPQYTQTGLIPPTTYFVFGQMILKGYVNSYDTTWKKPIINTFYGWNSVNIHMDCYPDSIISANEIIGSEGAASTQNTYNTKFPNNNTVNSNVMTRGDTTNRTNNRSWGSLGNSPIDTE